MKTRLLVTSIVVTIFAVVSLLHIANSYDFAPSTKENPYGVAARVLIEPTIPPSMIKPKVPSEPRDVLYFKYTSQEPVQIVGYNICNGILCIKDESLSYSPSNPTNANEPHKWGGGTLGDRPWNVGDTVHIRIKVKPVTISEDGTLVPQDGKMTFIDLGESKIIKSTSEHD